MSQTFEYFSAEVQRLFSVLKIRNKYAVEDACWVGHHLAKRGVFRCHPYEAFASAAVYIVLRLHGQERTLSEIAMVSRVLPRSAGDRYHMFHQKSLRKIYSAYLIIREELFDTFKRRITKEKLFKVFGPLDHKTFYLRTAVSWIHHLCDSLGVEEYIRTKALMILFACAKCNGGSLPTCYRPRSMAVSTIYLATVFCDPDGARGFKKRLCAEVGTSRGTINKVSSHIKGKVTLSEIFRIISSDDTESNRIYQL